MAKNDKPKKKSVATKTRVVTTEDSGKTKPVTKKSSSQSTAKKTVAVAKDVSKKTKTAAAASKVKPKKTRSKYNLLAAFWDYLKGAWYELTQVRWPNRRETWGMTIAVILFSAFFVALILGLDAIYKYLFDFILEG